MKKLPEKPGKIPSSSMFFNKFTKNFNPAHGFVKKLPIAQKMYHKLSAGCHLIEP